MKLTKITSILMALAAMAGFTGCDGEKDLIIIDGNLPIKTSSLYMLGDATPNGWSLDAPTPFSQTDEDPLVFSWEGPLNTGEMKLCLTPSNSWDIPFIRPASGGLEVTRAGFSDETFAMFAGDPDDKWVVKDAGVYSLRFDLRNWKYSMNFVREMDGPVIEPIVAEALFILGDAAPTGWDNENPTTTEKKSDYIFVYEGPLNTGELKACTSTGSWDIPFVRPASNGVKINRQGVAEENFLYSVNPDNKWKVEESGIYRLTFDLEHWTIKAEYTGEYTPAPKLYMIGEATEGGWSWDEATVIESSADNENIFVWEGDLHRGSMKAALEKDFGAPFYRPATDKCEINEHGAASHEMVFTTSPDDQWLVTAAGRYRLTFDTENMTFEATYLTGTVSFPTLYMIGDATAGGWSLDEATPITTDTENLYVWEGVLSTGEMKACFTRDFGADFYRPAVENCAISASGVASPAMLFTTDPDYKWVVKDAGKYRLTFNLADMTFEATYLESAVIIPDLYMIGEATAGGWSLDDATKFTPVEGNEGAYTWTGHLKAGIFKACTERDFSAPFYRPASAGVTIDENGVSDPRVVYTTGPDDQWNVLKEGTYTLVINIKDLTISATFHN